MKNLLLLLLLSITSLIWARADYFSVSDTLGSSAKMIGIGHIEGFSSHANVIFENPAGLSRTPKLTGHVFTTQRLDDVRFYEISAATRYKKVTLGMGLYTASVSGIYETSRNNNIISITNVFGYRTDNFKLGASLPYAPFNSIIGASFNYYQTKLYTTSGHGSNVDLGILSQPYQDIELSVTLKNIFTFQNVTYNDGATENLASSMCLSAKIPYKNFSFYTQLKKIQHQEPFFMAWGGEYALVPEWFTIIAGYDTYYNVAYQSRHRAAIGFELMLHKLAIQYSFQSSERQDSVLNHHFSIGYKQ